MTQPRFLDRYDCALLLAAAAYLYASLFATPFTPYALDGDQVYFWTYGLQLLHGEEVYRGFFQFTPPGTDLIYRGAFGLFGACLWVTNLVVLFLGIVLCGVCLRIARQILLRARASLAVAFYLVFVLGSTLDGTHHWFSLLMVMIAVVVLLGGQTFARIAMAGALLGIASFFTQTRGPAAALAISAWLLWLGRDRVWPDRLKRVACLMAVLAATWFAVNSYYIATVGLKSLWYFQVRYVHDHMVTGWNALSIGFPGTLSEANLSYIARWAFAFVVLPIVLALSLWRSSVNAREEQAERAKSVLLIALVGAALFVEIALSPNWFRFFCISLPGTILLIWLLGWMGRYEPAAAIILWIGVLGLAGQQIRAEHLLFSSVVELPAGRVATTPAKAEKWLWIAQHTQPGDYLLQAQWPNVYLPLDLRDPLYYLEVNPFDSESVRRSIQDLEAQRVRYVLESHAAPAPAFHEYLKAHYRLVHTFSNQEEVWER